MNIKEWIRACKEDWLSVNHKYDIASRKIQKSLKYNSNPEATVRHHLRDTEEQRKYNDEHYELWGFEIDESGNEHFEYGKYMIFVTSEEHLQIHSICDDTRKKISISQKIRLSRKDARRGHEFKKGHIPWNKGVASSEETRKRISINRRGKCVGEEHPFYGKHHTEESLKKIREASRKYWLDEDHRRQQSERGKGRKQSPETIAKRVEKLLGHETSEDTRKKISQANSGRKFSDEHKHKLSIARRKRITTDETKSKMSDSAKRVMSDLEHRKKISDTVKRQKQEKKALYDEYKLSGGILMWNDLQSFLKHHFKRNYVPTLIELKEALTDDSEG